MKKIVLFSVFRIYQSEESDGTTVMCFIQHFNDHKTPSKMADFDTIVHHFDSNVRNHTSRHMNDNKSTKHNHDITAFSVILNRALSYFSFFTNEHVTQEFNLNSGFCAVVGNE